MSSRRILDIRNIDVDGTSIYDLSSIIDANAPIIYLHPKEKYYVTDLDQWFNITQSKIKGKTMYRVPKNKFRYNSEPFNKNAPVYVYIRKDKDNEYIDIIYSIYFNYNGSKRLLGLVPVGAHDADLEQFIVRIDSSGKPINYLYSTHGEFQIFQPNEINTETGYPVVYSAVNSHALYRKPGSFFRIYGLGNDITSKSNKRIIPTIILLNKQHNLYIWPKNDPQWNTSITRGCFGSDGVSAISYRLDEKYKIITEFKNFNNCNINTLFIMTWFLITFLISHFIYKKIYGTYIYNALITINISEQFYYALALMFIVFYVLTIILKAIISIVLKFIGKKIGVELDKETIKDWIIPFKLY